MEPYVICGGEVWVDGAFTRRNLWIQNGKICEVKSECDIPETVRVVDASGIRVVPGFIDVHTHGAAGKDVNASTAEDLNHTIGKFFASQGTTSWLASVLTDTPEKTLWCIDQVRQASQVPGDYAQLLGTHLEGPFLSMDYRGSMPAHLLQKGNRELLLQYIEAGKGTVRYVTLAPEVEGVLDMIPEISKHIRVAIGHSGASYETAMAAIQAGAVSCTHTFNGMKLFHQHFPAIMGAVLETDVYCEAICDGRHLHPGTIRMLLKCKGIDRVIGITDSIMAAGLPDGRYRLGVNDVVVTDGDAMLADGSSRAGSTLTTGQAVKNVVHFTGRPLEEILPMYTTNPARMLGLEKQKGKICSGYDADLVFLDENMDVIRTFVGGREVYRR